MKKSCCLKENQVIVMKVRWSHTKFETATKRSDKVLVLTVLPKSWTIRKVQEELGAYNCMVHKAKELVKENGILSTPNPKPGHTLPEETTDLVQNFYECDSVRRMIPGCKDFVSVRQAEGRVHVQKRLMLSNWKKHISYSRRSTQIKKLASLNSLMLMLMFVRNVF